MQASFNRFMRQHGEWFDVIRNSEVVAQIQGLPNNDKSGPYIGFYEGSDVHQGDWIKGTKSNNLLYIDDLLSESAYGKVFQVKGYYLTERQYKKLEEEKEASIKPNVNYYLHGDNSRVNNHSKDYSVNVINASTNEVINEILKVLKESIDDKNEIDRLEKILKDMQNTQNTSLFVDHYKNFVSSAANHMTVLAPFIPALSQMIGK
ncbi:conserved hypothetical protein [Exiguobacterium sp. 8H]|nr:conserved hypothetical protein [Exiguobacterium sp. 8H]VXB92401.1 conserved hypothetical protein [Exiguobacterium sp. 8A]